MDMAYGKDSENAYLSTSPLWSLEVTGRKCLWGSKLIERNGESLEERLRELSENS